MRELGTLPQEADARRFADHLLAQGIATKLDPAAQGCVIWVRREDQVNQAKEEYTAFLANPNDPKYEASATAAKQARQEEARKEAQYRKNMVDVSRRWGGSSGGPTPITTLLLIASISITFLQGFEEHSPLYAWLSLVPPPSLDNLFPTLADTWSSGQWWRFFTPMLLHGGPIHLLFNMLWLYDLGRRVEGQLGSFRYSWMVIALSIAGNVAQYVLVGPSIGMSGVVYGLFGFAWMQWRYLGIMTYAISQQTIFMMMAWFVLGWLQTGQGGGPAVANINHTAGLLLGCLLGILPYWLRRWR